MSSLPSPTLQPLLSVLMDLLLLICLFILFLNQVLLRGIINTQQNSPILSAELDKF